MEFWNIYPLSYKLAVTNIPYETINFMVCVCVRFIRGQAYLISKTPCNNFFKWKLPPYFSHSKSSTASKHCLPVIKVMTSYRANLRMCIYPLLFTIILVFFRIFILFHFNGNKTWNHTIILMTGKKQEFRLPPPKHRLFSKLNSEFRQQNDDSTTIHNEGGS